jgi:hypothetical protein
MTHFVVLVVVPKVPVKYRQPPQVSVVVGEKGAFYSRSQRQRANGQYVRRESLGVVGDASEVTCPARMFAGDLSGM